MQHLLGQQTVLPIVVHIVFHCAVGLNGGDVAEKHKGAEPGSGLDACFFGFCYAVVPLVLSLFIVPLHHREKCCVTKYNSDNYFENL